MTKIKTTLIGFSTLTLVACSSTVIKTADMVNSEGTAHVCKGKVIGSSISLGNQMLAARNRDACVEFMSQKGFVRTEDLGCYPVIIEASSEQAMVLDSYKEDHDLSANTPARLVSINGIQVNDTASYKEQIFGKEGKELAFIFEQHGEQVSTSKSLYKCIK